MSPTYSLPIILVALIQVHFSVASMNSEEVNDPFQSTGYIKDDAYDVEWVGLLTRHGARTPKTYYFDQQEWGKTPMGYLTPEGMRQHNVLGQLMRQRYNQSPLPSQPEATQVYVVSDYYQRCHLSAMAFILGLYPDNTGENIASKNEFTAVPPNPDPEVQEIVQDMRLSGSSTSLPAILYNFGLVNIDSYENKNLMFSAEKHSVCKSVNYYLDQISSTSSFQAAQDYLNSTYWQPLVDIVNSQVSHFQLSHSEMSFDVAMDILDTYTSTNFAGLSKNFQLPDQIIYGLKKTLEYNYYDYQFGSWPLINSSLTIILSDVRTRITDIVNEVKDSAVFTLYSGHDHNFYAYFQLFLGLRGGLKLKDPVPPFAANLVFELLRSKSDGHYSVRVRYNDEILTLQACSSEPCPLDEFEQMVQDTVIPDLDTWCKAHK